MPTTRRPRQTTQPPQSEPEDAPTPEATEPESGEPLAEDHARDVADDEAARDVADDEAAREVELEETITCKRCGNTYAMDGPPDDFSCTDRRCPLNE